MKEIHSKAEELGNVLSHMYYRIVKINLTEDKYVFSQEDAEDSIERKWTKASESWKYYLEMGNVHPEDREVYANFMNLEFLRAKFHEGKKQIYQHYRRKINGEFRWNQAEIVKAAEYTEENQIVYVLIRDVHESYGKEIQMHKMEKHFGIIQSLNSIYFSSFYVDAEHDTYSSIYYAPWLEGIIPREGSYSQFLPVIVDKTIFPDDKNDLKQILSLLHIEKELRVENITEAKRSFCVEFRSVNRTARPNWCRVTVVAVDHRPNGKPGHVLVLLQDIDKERKNMEDNEKALQLLRDSYYRISIIDLNADYIHNLKIVDSEWEEEQGLYGAYERIMRSCAEKHVHPKDKDKFVRMLTVQNLKAYFQVKRDMVSFAYQRDVNGEYKWVQTEILPFDSYSEEDARVVWYVKNITEEKAKEMKHAQAMLRANAALRDAYEAANRANSAKTDFLSRMSHDIRTPMNAIIGMTAVAGTYLDDKERMADALNKITVASRHLLALINEVLDMSRIESGKVSLSVEKFNLSDLIDNLLNMVKPSIRQKGHHLQVHVSDIEHENVIGDSLRIQQAFINIVGNAVKYTPEGGNISITVSERPTKKVHTGCFEFIFEDDGIGMSKEFLEKLFDPFERAEDPYVLNVQGTGLGMPITKNIVQMMNGDIKVESEVGKGSKFTVTIFLELQNEETVSTEELLTYKKPKNTTEHVLDSISKKNFTGKRILLVEDNELNREIATEILQMTGLTVETAEDGREAVEKVSVSRSEYYDLIFMDIQMPTMNGYEATNAIRSLGRKDSWAIPIIAMTANAFAEDVVAAKNAGMNDHIAKPLDIHKLEKVLETWL